ncbi:MAG: cohesin domain-containing protein [Candidatus Eisenbacteria bacterium]
MTPRLPRSIGAIVAVLCLLGAGSLAGIARATDSFEPNDDPNNATELPNGVPLESWISVSGDLDWYHFTHADEQQQVNIVLSSLPLDTDYDMQLYFLNEQSTLDLVATSENPPNNDEVISGTGPAGEYFLVIYGFESTDFDPNDSYFLQASYGGGGGGNTPPQVSVTSPNGGEVFAVNSSQTIQYTATDQETPNGLAITIELSTNGGGSWSILTSGTSNTGSFPWTVPNTPTTQALIRVTANDGQATTSDASNGTFSIQAAGNQPPVVTVLSPNGGENLTGGSASSITYTATDVDDDDASLQITIEYSANGGGSWTQVAAGQSNTGSFSWTVPSAATTQGRVRVTASDGEASGNDTSNANFTITAAPTGSNTLAVTNGTGASGSTITVQLTLSNENNVKSLQTDLVFDPAVLSFSSFAGSGRAVTFSDSARVVSSGRFEWCSTPRPAPS